MKMTPEKLEQAKKLRDSGMFYREIGEVLGVGYGVVQYNLASGAKDKKATYHAAHSEKTKAYNAAYVASHKEENAAYLAANKERFTQYRKDFYRAHKDESRAYDVANKEAIAARKADYYLANRETILATCKVYRETHLPEMAAKSAVRRALIAGTMIGISIEQKAQIDEIYRKAAEEPNIRCYLCNELIPLGSRQVDHVRAVTNGGPTRPSNLAVTCRKCNLSKGSKTLEEMGLLL